MSDEATKHCPRVEDLLLKVINDLNEFEAKKLSDLKTELDAFVKKKAALVAEYRKQYPSLLKRWCEQHASIESLHGSMQSAFPGQQWKDLVAKCICQHYKDRDRLADRISRRLACARGVNETKRDDAQADFDWQRKYLDVLCASTQKIEAELNDADKLIQKIKATVPGAEQAVGLYWFWFKLLPSHRALAPANLPPGCNHMEQPNDVTLCETAKLEDCKAYEETCAPPYDWKPRPPSPYFGPKLLDPDGYEDQLNCAWSELRMAKDHLGVAEAKYKAEPDDVASLQQKLKDTNAKLEGEIIECLKKCKPEDKCCP